MFCRHYFACQKICLERIVPSVEPLILTARVSAVVVILIVLVFMKKR